MSMPLWFSNLVSWSAQVALLVLITGLLLRLFPIRHPRVLLAFCRGLLLLTLALPILQPWHRLSRVTPLPDLSGTFTVGPAAPAPAAAYWHFPSMPVVAKGIGVVLVGGIALRFVLLALGLIRLRRLRLASAPVTGQDPSATILDQMLAKVGVNAEFRLSASVDSPVTYGLINPVVLLPDNFLSTDARLQSVIACHELLHARRRDWPQHLIEEIVRAVFWFHPAILWLISRIRIAREQLVDLEVVRVTNARKAYLQALLEFTQRGARTAAVPAPPFLTQHQLVERISLISKEVHMSRRRLLVSLGVISCCLFIVVGLSAWSFPLKRAPRQSDSSPSNIIVPGGPSDGISGGVSGGVAGGVTSGVTGGIDGALTTHAPTDIPQVDSSTLVIDTVKRGPMVRQVRGLGKLVRAAGSTNLIAQVTLPAFLTADVKAGQSASVASQKGPLSNGHVLSVGPSGSGDTRTIDIALDTKSEGADANLEIDASIDIEKIDSTLQVGRPVHGAANSETSLFRLDNNGTDATRINVKLGRASVNSIEILSGLKEGDRVIISDMSEVGNADHIHLTNQITRLRIESHAHSELQRFW
jgi:beta-lactamase regulating signal transducer with metallopeptidase domain